MEFVGRQVELDAVTARLRATVDGAGQVVLLSGEPGIGKTRLAQEITAVARAMDMTTCWGRAFEDEGSPPYWPFRQVLRELVRLRSPGELAGDLALVAPEVGTATTPEERFRVFEAVTEYLSAMPALLIVLDDLHWTDPPTLRLLVHLARAVRSMRVMIVATYRDTEVRGRPALSSALASLAHDVTRVRLVGLTNDEVGVQLAGLTGEAVDAAVVAKISRRTQGNPFFVGELGRLLPDGSESLPDGVRDAVRARLAVLSPLCREVVALSAVLGSDVDPSVVAAVVGRPVSDVVAALDEATSAGVLSDARFTHDLVRDAARLDMPTTDRLAIHQRIASCYEDRPDATLRTAEIAHHWLASLPTGDARKAAEWAERAADIAMAQLAWESAAVLYERALAAYPATPNVRSRLLCRQGIAQLRQLDIKGAVDTLLLAASAAREAADANAIAEVALAMESISSSDWVATGKALCDEALAALPPDDNPLRARLVAQRAAEAAFFGASEVDELSADALAMAERTGDPKALRAALRSRQLARSGPDGVLERLRLADRMLAIGDPEAQLWGRLWRFDAYCQLGRIDDAEAEVLPVGEAAARIRTPVARWHHLRAQAAIAHGRGHFAHARELAETAYRLAGTTSAGWEIQQVTISMLASICSVTGDEQEILDRHGGEYLLNPPEIVAPLVGIWHLTCGRMDVARRCYQPKLVHEPLSRMRWLGTMCGLSLMSAAFDDKPTAAAAYDRLKPYGHLIMCGGAGVVTMHGAVDSALGAAAATVGRLDDSVKHLRQAIETNDRAGLRPDAAATRCQLAEVLDRRRRPGDEAEAAALATSAVAMATEMGMKRLIEKAQTLTGSHQGPLSKREQEIARLVGQGLTNKQIAAAAHISVRTVESHVQSILTKLGVSTRTQIATRTPQ